MNRLCLLLVLSVGLPPTSPAGAVGQDRESLSGTLVVLNKGANTATLIDLATERTVATLPTGAQPHELAVSRDGRLAVATNYGTNTLTVVDLTRVSVARTIDLGRHWRPHGIAFLPGDSLVAVTSETSRAVLVVRVDTGRTVRTISTEAGGSHMLAMVENGRWIYTSNGQGASVSGLDLSTGRRARAYDVPAQPEAITVTAGGEEIWVGSNAEGTVTVLNPLTGQPKGSLSGFSWPYRILITPDQRSALIPDLRRHDLRIFDRNTRRELATLEFPGAGPQGITLSLDGSTAFLSLSRQDRVAVIDLRSRRVVGHYPTGSGPDGIGVSVVTR